MFAVRGRRAVLVCAHMQTGLSVCMHVGNEEGECEARERSLSGGIKALLQW